MGRDELVELLGRAGLEVVGDWQVEEVLRAPAAWRWVAAREAGPAVKVRSDRPDLVAELNAQWHRLASEAGVLGADGVFLIDLPVSRSWVRVRLTDGWDLAGVLGERPGRPEFVTLSLDGDTLLGVTSEEHAVRGAYDVRFVAVDRIGERREEAARAAAEETPQERAAAWAALFEGLKPTEELLDAWAGGLARSPAVPVELRGAALFRSRWGFYAHLPAEVVEAAVSHPEWKMRALVADTSPDLTPEQWERLLLGEQDERDRWRMTMIAADRWAELTEDTYRELATDPSARVRSEAALLKGLPAALLVALAADPDDGVRAVACRPAWPHLDAEGRQALLADPHGIVRARVRPLYHREHPMPRSVYEAGGIESSALETCLLERDLAEHVARHGERSERYALAGNPRLDPDLVALLGEDPDDHVRFVVSTRPDLTEEQRAAIPIEADPVTRYRELDWVKALHEDEDEDAMRRLAASSHFLVRRSVARARRLPADVVERLARDEDRVVQLFLAESCDDAPADMLLRVWRWWTGSLTVPDRPRGHPNFPRHDLMRYADDPSPRMRRLALDDPASTPELVERLSRDSSAEVRYRAATDPRLSAAAAARLLEDPHDSVRYAAAVHPHLPARLLTGLLRDHRTAETAVRNPAVPVEAMRHMAEWISRSATPADG